LSAGFTALVVLVCYAGCALLVAAPHYRVIDTGVVGSWRQIGAVAAAGLFALLAYAAWRGDFFHAMYYSGDFGSASVGRLLFAHDALATEAVGALEIAALAGATAMWRGKGRGR
jgi:hypothetical protein